MAMGSTGSSSLLARADEADKTSSSSLQPQAALETTAPRPGAGDLAITRRADRSATTDLGAAGSTRGLARSGMSQRLGGVQLLGEPTGAFKEDPNKLGSIIEDPTAARGRGRTTTSQQTDQERFPDIFQINA